MEAQRDEDRGRARVDHVILYVADIRLAVRFYSDVAGLRLKFAEHGYAEFVTEGTKFGLFERGGLPELLGNEASDGRPGGEVLFLVDDVEAEAARLRKAGTVRILSGPVDRPWGQRTLHVEDPDGHVVEFAQPIPRRRPRE